MNILKTLFSFRGKITRKQWWIWNTTAFVAILWVWFPITFISVFAFGDRPNPPPLAGVFIMVSFLMIIISSLWISLAINIKRLRDRGRKLLSMTLILILSPALYFFFGSIPGLFFALINQEIDYFFNVAICLILALWPIIELGFLKGEHTEIDNVVKQ